MKNPKYMTRDCIPLSLQNLFYHRNCSVMKINDVVEEATTARELMEGLNKLNLYEKFTIDKTTDTYVRLISTDCFGNTHYFKAEYDKRPSRKLKDYYDPMCDNYVIPFDEMTDEMMKEALSILKDHPYEGKPHTYLMIVYNDDIGDNWCITSWLEEM